MEKSHKMSEIRVIIWILKFTENFGEDSFPVDIFSPKHGNFKMKPKMFKNII